jgi:RNA-directed DNA polymerase
MSRLLAILTKATGLSGFDLAQVITSAPRRYKTFRIPKRRGGYRMMAQPAREVKALQRAIVAEYLQGLPVHPAATAYEHGSSIRENATRHATNGPILKMDLQDFFPSIRDHDWLRYCRDVGLFDNDEERLVSTKILFFRPKGSSVLRLAIGAPSSPKVSNLLMYEFDRIVSQAVSKDFVTYTRYADDLTFSAKRTGYLNGVDKAVRLALRSLEYPRLKLNDDKRVLATKKYHRQITGIVLTNDGRISLGHQRKRTLRAALHHFVTGRLAINEARRLHGYLAFAKDVEPAFYAKLEAHYGKEALANLAAVQLEEFSPDKS